MNQDTLLFRTGQFAKLHHLNKRTLHYYDEIGLFSPEYKGENGYRYYTYRQSAALENILALRELGMSIEEVKEYSDMPTPKAFREIAAQKTRELDAQIKRLRTLKSLLQEKQRALALCDEIFDGKTEVLHCEKQYLLLTPLLDSGDTRNMMQIMEHLHTAQNWNAYKMGCGSYISMEKVEKNEFEFYDGVFTPVTRPGRGEDFFLRPAGDYLCGYCVGDWNKIPGMYQKMLARAEEEGVRLTGYCYEIGLNEFAIAEPGEYVTQIMVKIQTHEL